MTVITVTKALEFDDMMIGNLIVDGFLCTGYNFIDAQLCAEKIMQGGRVHNACTGAVISADKIKHAIQRYLTAETQNDIESVCDNASIIIRSII